MRMRDAYERGATAPEEDRKRMTADASLVYQPGQLRQKTIQAQEDEEERTRIVYFCAKCQKVEDV